MGLQLVYKSAEVRLTQMLADLRVQPTGWMALHFHLDRLLDEYKSEYQIKIAINLINDLLKNYDGHLFLMADSSIMVLCNRLEQVIQEKLVFQLRYLYMDDPLSYTESGMENPQFVTVYDIKHNWQAFNEVCTRYMAMVARGQPIALQPLGTPVAELAAPQEVAAERMPVLEKAPLPEAIMPAPAALGGEFSASRLAAMENNLRMADLQATLRRQPVCAVYADLSLRRLYEELYINMGHLRRMMQSDVDFLSNRWLFRYITQILDARMIDLLRINPGRYLESPISINLNVETVLSSRFSELDAIIPAAKKVAIVVELPVVDAFADMTAFNLAVAEAQKLGYRVCLDGLTTASFISIQRSQFTVDLLKVQWNGEGASEHMRESAMARAVQDAGSNRIILCRCDNKKAIEYGQSMGISLFQGRFIDAVLNPTSKVEN